MNFVIKHSFIFGIVIVILLIYRSWFLKIPITASDYPYYYSERLGDFTWQPYIWSTMASNGFGGVLTPILNLYTYIAVGVRFFVFTFHISWNLASRMLIFWPVLVAGTMSSFFLCREIVGSKSFSIIGSLIYMTNTYVLMIAGGGQMGLVLAYSIAPLVLYGFIRRHTVWFTVSIACMLLFDLRFSALLFFCVILFVIIVIPIRAWAGTIEFFILPVIVTLGLHSFWVIPSLFSHGFTVPDGNENPLWLQFLSWAEYSKTFTLLHPNWPENIFGKTYFTRPEFLFLPLITWGTFVYIRKLSIIKKVREIIYFFVLGSIGAFFAKGVNPPFGQIYTWLFSYLPFFSAFRDPTKFYILTSLSYMILIPFALSIYAAAIKTKWPRRSLSFGKSSVLFLFLFYWTYLLLPFFQGQVRGTFYKKIIPAEYSQFEHLVTSTREFGRILAVPWKNRFVFESENHPIIDSSILYKTSDISTIVQKLSEPKNIFQYKKLGIKYLVVPDDFTGEIFVKDRKKDLMIRQQIVSALDVNPDLTKIKKFGGLSVYEFSKSTGLFTSVLPNTDFVVHPSYRINPVTYAVHVQTDSRPLEISFGQTFDADWQLWDGEKIIQSHKNSDGMNSFTLDSNATSQVFVHYKAQKYAYIGIYGTLITFFLLGVTVFIRYRKNRFVVWILPVLCISAILVPLVRYYQNGYFRNCIRDGNIWWSNEWKIIHNPFTGSDMTVSAYGGSELRFSVRGTKSITIRVSSSNEEYGNVQGFDFYVDGEKYTQETYRIESNNYSYEIPIKKQNAPVNIRIKHWCGSTYSTPCNLAIEEIRVDHHAKISKTSSSIPKKIAVLGDSISSLFGASNYTYQLAEKLGMQMHNVGIYGMSVTKNPKRESGLNHVRRDVLAFQPDAIVLFLGTNDVYDTVSEEEFSKNYSELIDMIRKNNIKTDIVLVGILHRTDVPSDAIIRFNALIEKIASDHSVVFLNPYSWLDAGDLQDGLHPTVQSHTKLAGILYEKLKPILSKQHQ